MKKIKNWIDDVDLLLKSVPPLVTILFVLSVVCMNLCANKELNLGFLVTDCGILVSWLSFLTQDMVTKRFGPKAAIKLSITALFFNLGCCVLFFAVSRIPSFWAMAYDLGEVANEALDATIGGTWYVLLGSSIAFVVSAVCNCFINYLIGVACKVDNFITYALRTYISTFLGQFIDNFVFALLVSHLFFGWTLVQCVIAAVTTGIVELVCEIIFSPIGYKVCKRWQAEGVGSEYLNKNS